MKYSYFCWIFFKQNEPKFNSRRTFQSTLFTFVKKDQPKHPESGLGSLKIIIARRVIDNEVNYRCSLQKLNSTLMIREFCRMEFISPSTVDVLDLLRSHYDNWVIAKGFLNLLGTSPKHIFGKVPASPPATIAQLRMTSSWKSRTTKDYSDWRLIFSRDRLRKSQTMVVANYLQL